MAHRANGVDAHCHADLFPDPISLRRIIEERQIATLAVTTTPRAFEKNIDLFGSSPFIQVALGIHPELADSKEANRELLASLIDSTNFVGEVGLDGRSHVFRSIDAQRHVFHFVLKLCSGKQKTLSVHSPRAVKEVLDCLELFVPESDTVKILHWFTGSKSDARRALDLGCYFSVNQAMLTNPQSRAVALTLPLDRILTETDGPFNKREGKPLEPPDALHAIRDLAILLRRPETAILEQVLVTAQKIFDV